MPCIPSRNNMIQNGTHAWTAPKVVALKSTCILVSTSNMQQHRIPFVIGTLGEVGGRRVGDPTPPPPPPNLSYSCEPKEMTLNPKP